ncbi:glycerophosphodiester phosphodiesterase family protein [Serratia marcescens]|uniref:glycerophosphodiester phosphodiesterase family protein n=1 Tax=Serratia marcescens TaxID=615 RepID=UPI0034D60DBA
MCNLSMMGKMSAVGYLILSILGSFAYAKSDNILIRDEARRGAKASPPRGTLIELLITPDVNSNYIPIAAHRAQIMGSNLPENSLSAIKHVKDLDAAEILELDIKITSDGIPYLMHDSYLQRTTNFVDTVVGDYAAKEYGLSSGKYSWQEITKLYLKNVDGTNSSEHPVAFEDVLIWVRDNTNMLINLDINEPAVFDAVWKIVRDRDAFDVCIFKGRHNREEFKSKYYDGLSPVQKEKLIYFPIIPDPTKDYPNKAIDFYNHWESDIVKVAKGYEIGYKKDVPNSSFPVESKVLEVLSAIRKDKRVRVHVFSAMPDNYQGRYIGNVNIDQCCNATVDSRGDLEYLFDPFDKLNMEKGVNGYIITDDAINLEKYLSILGKRELKIDKLRELL